MIIVAGEALLRAANPTGALRGPPSPGFGRETAAPEVTKMSMTY